MKQLLVFIAVFFALVCCARADGGHDLPQQDVLAHSCGDWAWYARVSKSRDLSLIETPISNEQTEFFARQKGPGEQWRPLPVLSGRAVAMASQMSQLVVLMNDGQWFTLWADGSSTGQALPAGGKIRTFADDGEDLWAVGTVIGGIRIANEAILRDNATTAPTTAPLASVATTAPVISDLPTRLVVFHQTNGRWATVAELPADVPTTNDEDFSLAILNGAPLVSFRTLDGSVSTLRFSDQAWQAVGAVHAATTQPVSNFQLLSDGFKPMLWFTTGNDAGVLCPDLSTGLTQAPALKWSGNTKLDGTPTADFTGGYVCVFGPVGDKVFEQRYNTNGEPIESAAELSVPDTSEGMLPRWLEAVLLAFLGFSVGARVFRSWAGQETAVESPPPAPLPARLLAGLIDAIPVIGAGIFVFVQISQMPAPQSSVDSITLIVAGGAIAVYLLHTTLSELITGRSVGKWILGLKVVTLDGSTPTHAQLLIRNLLRLVDPLVMILFTPQRQRDADTVANTMVIRAGTKPADADSQEMKESGADKPD